MYYFIIQKHFRIYILWRSIFHQIVLIFYDCAIACMVINMPPLYFIHSPFYRFTLIIFLYSYTVSFLLQRLAFVSVKKSACRKNYSHTFIRSFLICYGEYQYFFFVNWVELILIKCNFNKRIHYGYFNQLHLWTFYNQAALTYQSENFKCQAVL